MSLYAEGATGFIFVYEYICSVRKMKETTMNGRGIGMAKKTAELKIEDALWQAADQLRGSMDASLL